MTLRRSKKRPSSASRAARTHSNNNKGNEVSETPHTQRNQTADTCLYWQLLRFQTRQKSATFPLEDGKTARCRLARTAHTPPRCPLSSRRQLPWPCCAATEHEMSLPSLVLSAAVLLQAPAPAPVLPPVPVPMESPTQPQALQPLRWHQTQHPTVAGLRFPASTSTPAASPYHARHAHGQRERVPAQPARLLLWWREQTTQKVQLSPPSSLQDRHALSSRLGAGRS